MRIIIIMLCFLFHSCNNNSTEKETGLVEAKYVMPYPVGLAYNCMTGFNTPPSHIGTFTYSVDFTMPIGTLVTAARSGQVVYILENYLDKDATEGHENVVIVMHEDTTYARYVHLTRNGAHVEINQHVIPGDTIGFSGSSGTNGGPHLHFDVTKTFEGRSDQTIPFAFTNTTSHPHGLQRGITYEAFPY
jgi:hypothetical protein